MKQQKFEQWAKKQLASVLGSVIIDDDRDSWLVFGKYNITKRNNDYIVTKNGDSVAKFSSKRSAISYCVAEKHGNYSLGRNIVSLDQEKFYLQSDITCRQQQAQRSKNVAFKDMVEIKLQSKILHLHRVSSQLENCINLAKYLQIKGFSNETARVGRA